MSLANYLTFARIFISPIFFFVYLEHDWLGFSSYMLPFVLLFLLTLSEASDAFDGYIARKFNQVTDLGKILDPMADSISRTSVFLTFTLAPVNLPILYIFVFLYRDSVISTLRTICAFKGFALAARWSGKIKAVVQATVAFIILLLMIPHSYGLITTATLQTISSLLVGFAAFYAFFSGIDYIVANRFYIKKLLMEKKACP
jgi:CDP-diacylglycerol--glycerol-3-phosphate 3-phosphatidyltransferase